MRTFHTREVSLMLTLWKSLVRSRLEYCIENWRYPKYRNGAEDLHSQDLRLPKHELLATVEIPQHVFIRKAPGKIPHHIHLEDVRRESAKHHHFRWKPGQRGSECTIRTVNRKAPRHIQKLVYASLPYHGQQLFNSLPAPLRNLTGCTVELFKRRLDRYLQTIPDEAQIPGYTAQRRADSNSLLDMTRFAHAYQDHRVEVPGDTHTVTLGNRGVSNAITVI